MDKRREELTKLKTYIEEIDNELSMILQSLQWDRKHLLNNPVMVPCRYDSNHKVPPDKIEKHEKDCFLKQHGYTKEDSLLPDSLDPESSTLVKLSKEDIAHIIENAARSDPLFKRGIGCRGPEPMSLERLQSSYTSDERRAIHDAVVSAVPSCHDLTDLVLLSGDDEQSSKVVLSRMEILAELRNMRRRRAKYRVAPKTRNYSDVLRDVIKTQMEHYNEAQGKSVPKDTFNEQDINQATDNSKDGDQRRSKQLSRDDDRRRYDRCGRDSSIYSEDIEIKREREDSTERRRHYSRGRSDRARNEDSRERRDSYRSKQGYNERSKERRNDDGSRDWHYRDRKRRYNEDYENDDKYRKLTKKIKQEPNTKDKKYGDDLNREYYSEESLRRTRKYGEHDRERRDKGRNNHHIGESRERRCDEDTSRNYKHIDKTNYGDERRSLERRQNDYRHRVNPSGRLCIKQEREDSISRDDMSKYDRHKSKGAIDKRRSRERRERDTEREKRYRYREKSNERLYIKQEREESIPTEDMSKYEMHKLKDGRHRYKELKDRSYRESSYDNYTTDKSTKEQSLKRYYDTVPAEEIYDPKKTIKEEK